MDEDDKKPREVNPIRSIGCVVGYFIVGLATVSYTHQTLPTKRKV